MPRTRFHNKKKTVDGVTHDSGYEYQVYLDLCQEYPRVWRQVEIYLMPITQVYCTIGYKPRYKKTVTRRKYIMDFIVQDDTGRYIAVEAKGYKTEIYKLKRDLFLHLYIANGEEMLLENTVITLDEYQVRNQGEPLEVYRPYVPKRKG